MRKIVFLFGIIGIASAAAIAASRAYFYQSAGSGGNDFAAAVLDLKISSHGWLNGKEDASTTWASLKNLSEGDEYYNFSGLKPGDWGENTISMSAQSVPAYACLKVKITDSGENGVTSGEIAAGEDASASVGDLQDFVHFIFWADNGNNVLESGETGGIFATGTAAELSGGGYYKTVADAYNNVWSGTGSPLSPGTVYSIGQGWCLGNITVDAVPAADDGATPASSGPGWHCDGKVLGINKTQTDFFKADVTFKAFQAAGNGALDCGAIPVSY